MMGQLRRGLEQVARASVPRKSKPQVIERTLASGARVILRRDHDAPTVAARVVWPGGVLRETAASSGINAFLADVITRGCGDRSAAEIAEDIDQISGGLRGSAGRNSFGLRAEWLSKHWRHGFDLLADCILHPTFPAVEVERERRHLLAEIEREESSATVMVSRLLRSALYGAHPYGRSVLGTKRSIEAMSREQLVKFYRRHYPASEMTIALVGDFEPEQVLERLERRFGTATGAAPDLAKNGRAKVSQKQARQVFAYLEREQAQIAVGFPGLTVDHKDRYALEILMTLLGGQGGRLFASLREERSLVYRVGAHTFEGLEPGFATIHFACAPEKMEEALSVVRTAVAEVQQKAVSRAELQRIKRYLSGTHAVASQRRAAVAASMAFHEAFGVGHNEHRRYASALSKVSAADVLRVAKRHLQWDKSIIATVSPPQASPEAARRTRGRVMKTQRRTR
jgi:zinc protease